MVSIRFNINDVWLFLWDILLAQTNPNENIFQKVITHILSTFDILWKMSKTYDVNIRQAAHNNNFWWNLKQLPRVLKSNYSKRFPKNRLWQSSWSKVLIKIASNKIDFKNGYSVKYQSYIYDSVKHLWWTFFCKNFKFIIESWQSPN